MPFTVAVAQPVVASGDLAATAAAHAALVREARARLVVFPELSLTGYELEAPPVALADRAFDRLVDACRETGTTALAGAPVREDGTEHIATLAVDGDGARVAYRKAWLGGAERARFAPGTDAAVLDVDGWRVGLGICKDTGTDAHVTGLAGQRLDLYAAGLVHHAAERDELAVRARTIARTTGAHVAFASFAGPTGGGYANTAGGSGIWAPTGDLLVQADARSGQVVRATLEPGRR